MTRRSFFKLVAGVLTGACGTGWLWKRKPMVSTSSGWENWTAPYEKVSRADFERKARELVKTMEFIAPASIGSEYVVGLGRRIDDAFWEL